MIPKAELAQHPRETESENYIIASQTLSTDEMRGGVVGTNEIQDEGICHPKKDIGTPIAILCCQASPLASKVSYYKDIVPGLVILGVAQG